MAGQASPPDTGAQPAVQADDGTLAPAPAGGKRLTDSKRDADGVLTRDGAGDRTDHAFRRESKHRITQSVSAAMTTPTEEIAAATDVRFAEAAGNPDWVVVIHDRRYPEVKPGLLTMSEAGSFDGASKVLADGSRAVRADQPEALRVIREHAVSALIKQWSLSSNDENEQSLAIQQAVQAEFGLADVAPWELTSSLARRVRERTAKHGSVYQDFARAQYQATQAELAARGISRLVLYRGFKWNSDHPAPSWAQTPDGSVASAPQWRPLSSWSSDPAVARHFASHHADNTLVAASVPASRILSCAQTGVGCLRESEFVVLATPGTIRIRKGAKGTD
jgi:hypothetical protein